MFLLQQFLLKLMPRTKTPRFVMCVSVHIVHRAMRKKWTSSQGVLSHAFQFPVDVVLFIRTRVDNSCQCCQSLCDVPTMKLLMLAIPVTAWMRVQLIFFSVGLVTLVQSTFTIGTCFVIVIFEIREKFVGVLVGFAFEPGWQLCTMLLRLPTYDLRLLAVVCRCLRVRAEKRFKKLATTPTTLAYMALRDTMGSKLKLTGGLSSVVKDMFSKIDLDNNGILERDEIRYLCMDMCVYVCGRNEVITFVFGLTIAQRIFGRA